MLPAGTPTIRITRLVLCVVLIVAGASAQPQPALASVENGPMQPIHGFLQAMGNADEDALAAVFAEEATVFMPFAQVPRRLNGHAEVRKVFGSFFAALRARRSAPYMQLNVVDVQVQNFGDTAVVTLHLGDTAAAADTQPAGAARRTFVVRRSGEQWLIVHLHASNLNPPAPPAGKQ